MFFAFFLFFNVLLFVIVVQGRFCGNEAIAILLN